MRIRTFLALFVPAVSAGWWAQRAFSERSGTTKVADGKLAPAFTGSRVSGPPAPPPQLVESPPDLRAAQDAMRGARSKVDERIGDLEPRPRKRRPRKPAAGPDS